MKRVLVLVSIAIVLAGIPVLYTHAQTVNIQQVDMLWEGADSYVPPFYKGRALPANNGLIRVVAVAPISFPKQLTYTWTENGSIAQDSSGVNKTSFVFKNTTLENTEDIELGVKSGSFSGIGNVSIDPINPVVTGYLSANGFVDYANGSNTSLTTDQQGAIIHFEPYFFSIQKNITNDLNFSYTDNGNSIASGSMENELRLSKPQGGGASQFTLTVSTNTYSLQNINKPFSVNFN